MRDQLNVLIRQAAAAGEFDYLIDVNSVWEDQANLGKWATAGGTPTPDGTHPSALMAAAAGGLVWQTVQRIIARSFPWL